MRPLLLGFAGLALFLGSLVMAPLRSEVASPIGPAHAVVQDAVGYPDTHVVSCQT